ncbi:MAG: tRNA-binding protein [Chlamydiia bacterium]|nr:tRNA-binding protein [Chlamydiia bacterium]
MNMISWDDFTKVELRIGTIVEATEFPEARRPAYKIKVDLGNELEIKRSSAQITQAYSPDEIVGKQVLCVTNFPPKQIGPYISEVLVTGFVCDKEVVLCSPDKAIPNGTRLL